MKAYYKIPSAVVVILLILAVASACTPFSYQVLVQREGTGEKVKGAQVIIEVTGNAPLTGYTDNNGFARIFVDASYAGKPGRLRVEAIGYEPYWKEMNISKNSLPDMIYLVISPSPTPTATSTPTVTPTVTISPPPPPDMVLIPAGEFLMGSTDSDEHADSNEKPKHSVYLDDFYIDVTEVTNEMFRFFIKVTGYKTQAEQEGHSWKNDPNISKNGGWVEEIGADWQHPWGPGSHLIGLDNYPVIRVSWNDAVAYCKWRGRRLPTEAEWEKAARGTDGQLYPWGNKTYEGTFLNFCDKNCPESWANQKFDDGYAKTSPVKSYPLGVSPYNVFDMAGNVWEWVMDWYSDTYYPNSPEYDPLGPTSGQYHVIKGGSWSNGGSSSRAANRSNFQPDYSNQTLGFRCARSAPSPSTPGTPVATPTP